MMTDTKDYFEQGRQDARHFTASQAYASFSTYTRASEAIQLFWPPIDSPVASMVATPMPRPRQAWLKGFTAERGRILTENAVTCIACGQMLPKEKSR